MELGGIRGGTWGTGLLEWLGGFVGQALGGGLRGIGPALAGNVGAGSAFALSRDGNQDVDVPMLAPARSRCRWVDGEPVPQWGWLIVAYEENNCR